MQISNKDILYHNKTVRLSVYIIESKYQLHYTFTSRELQIATKIFKVLCLESNNNWYSKIAKC